MADDEGRLTANPIVLSASLFPFSGDPQTAINLQKAIVRMESLRDDKDNAPLIGLYQIGKAAYIYHPNWHKYQYINPKNKQMNALPKPGPMARYKGERKNVNAYGYTLNE